MTLITIPHKLKSLPKSPGVYQFIDKHGKILYIGKAKNLRSRVRQYFAGNDERPQIPFLMEEAVDFNYTLVNTELESLYLERSLIQTHRPKYNIDLRDDKNYAFLVFDYSTPIPQIVIKRKLTPAISNQESITSPTHTSLTSKRLTPPSPPLWPKRGQGEFFGPYTSVKKIRDLIFTIRKIFGLCSAQKPGKPCFYFHLHRCPGICNGTITLAEYNLHLKKIKLFLSGKISPTIKAIKTEMQKLAKRKKFEKAAKLRDQLLALEILLAKQNMILTKPVSWDIFGQWTEHETTSINLFKIREGKMIGKENFIYFHPDIRIKSGSTDTCGYQINSPLPPSLAKEGAGGVLQTFLEKYYSETSDLPKKIFLPFKIPNQNLILQLIRHRFKKTVKIHIPSKSKAKELTNLSILNAQEHLKNHVSHKANHLDAIQTALDDLKNLLKLPALPRRIECYDISNTQGTNSVGSMVVFQDGLPKKSEYRKFKIRINPPAGGPDDFAMMKEMLTRRLMRSQTGLKSENPNPKFETNHTLQNTKLKPWDLPDLIIVDGGKGQLSAALSVLNAKRYSLNAIPIIGLAKRLEEIFLPNQSLPLLLPHTSPTLQLLQRIRDEAHRFGITFHRKLRSQQAVKSALDEIPGIGPKTKKLLKTHFGTITDIKNANFDDLVNTVGLKLAQTLKTHL